MKNVRHTPRGRALQRHARQAVRTPTPEETTVSETRTFNSGDTIPDDVRCVLDERGHRWWRDERGWDDRNGSRLMLDRSLLNGGPVTEVDQ